MAETYESKQCLENSPSLYCHDQGSLVDISIRDSTFIENTFCLGDEGIGNAMKLWDSTNQYKKTVFENTKFIANMIQGLIAMQFSHHVNDGICVQDNSVEGCEGIRDIEV